MVPSLKKNVRSLFTAAACILAFIALDTKTSSAQGGGKSIRDSVISLSMLNASISANISGADFGERFGLNFGLGVHFSRKTDKNYLWGLNYNFMFGNEIFEPDMLRHLRAASGDVFDMDGEPANILFFLRGHMAGGHVGKIFPIFGPNPNSGLIIRVGGGYMQHKISVESRRNDVRGLRDEYRDGYDRLAVGFYTQQFIGYQHLATSRLTNFFIGFEFNQGFTQNVRLWNFDAMQRDTGSRFELLSGLRFGWTIPMYRRMPQEYYTF
ncbi:MAG: hypothetical protein ACXITV_11445 [Luteibaculaceae bacterium]